MKEIEINGIEGLSEAASRFIEMCRRGRVYAFYGQMGAGKTTFISEVCRQLGSDQEANSPTFSIVNEYETSRWGRIYHLDCYRLDSAEEAFDIGVEDYFCSGDTCFVEWPERVEEFLPGDTVRVELEVRDDGSRLLRYED